jgi:DinB superfamily
MDPASPPTLSELLRRMDAGWQTMLDSVHALPNEQLELHIGDGGWTRKQMLAHVGTWHDRTTERISRFRETGVPPDIDEAEDAINANAARAATGRTTGEIVRTMEDSFKRLRREVGLLTDEQLAANDWWAVAIVRGNSFGHYEEHLPDLEPARR